VDQRHEAGRQDRRRLQQRVARRACLTREQWVLVSAPQTRNVGSRACAATRSP
jgi:hypothetical protein